MRIPTNAAVPVIMAGVDAFIQECRSDGAPIPEREYLMSRVFHVIGNIDSGGGAGINSLKRNQSVVLVRKSESPWFGVTTSEEA